MSQENPNLRHEMLNFTRQGKAFQTNHDAWKHLHSDLLALEHSNIQNVLGAILKAADSIIENTLERLIELSSLEEIKEALTAYFSKQKFSQIKDAETITRLEKIIENSSIETIAKTILETRSAILKKAA